MLKCLKPFCRILKNKDRWLKKFIGNSAFPNFFGLWSDTVLLWKKLNPYGQANNSGWDNPYLARLKVVDLFEERANPFDQNRQLILVKFTSCVIEI